MRNELAKVEPFIHDSVLLARGKKPNYKTGVQLCGFSCSITNGMIRFVCEESLKYRSYSVLRDNQEAADPTSPLVQERMSVPWSSIILASLLLDISSSTSISTVRLISTLLRVQNPPARYLRRMVCSSHQVRYQKVTPFSVSSKGRPSVLDSSEESGQTSFTVIGNNTELWNN